MQLNHGLHLAYCTNIHRGESWAQTFDTLQKYTLAVRDRVSKGKYVGLLNLGAEGTMLVAAVTVPPSFLKAGLSLAMASRVVSRGCSSVAN